MTRIEVGASERGGAPWRAAGVRRGALALALGVLGLAAGLEAQSPCGCGTSRSFDEAIEDDSLAVVAGLVLLAEGSPRSKDDLIHARQSHPHPWLRYLVLAERSWKHEARWLWIERPWGQCGSVLRPGRSYLMTLPRAALGDRQGASGIPTVTVDGCQRVERLDLAQEHVERLGAPLAKIDVRQVVREEYHRRIESLVSTRTACLKYAGARAGSPVSMRPGEWSRIAAPAAGDGVEWNVIQNGTSDEGKDDVVVVASNPTDCWLRIVPEISRRWRAEGSARRAGPAAGLTFQDGWVPPYWRGALVVARDLPWIREALWRVEPFAVGRVSSQPRLTGLSDLRTPQFAVTALDPPIGSYVDSGRTIRASIWWNGFASGVAGYRAGLVFESKDGSLVPARSSEPASAALKVETKTAQVETVLTSELLDRLADPLVVRFVVLGPDGAEIVDSTRPIAYPRGSEPPLEPVPPPEQGAWYAGGPGDTCDRAIVVRGVSSVQEGIAAERAWWNAEYPGSRMESQGVGGNMEDGPVVDLITLRLADGSEKQLCFDITEFWGAPARPGAPR